MCACVCTHVCVCVCEWVCLCACVQLAALVCRYVCVTVDVCITSNLLYVKSNLIVHCLCEFGFCVCVCVCVCVCERESVFMGLPTVRVCSLNRAVFVMN